MKKIKNETDYAKALAEIDRLWNAKAGTKEGKRVEELSEMLDAYERKNQSSVTRCHAIEPPDPEVAIKFRKEQERGYEYIEEFGTDFIRDRLYETDD